MVKEKPENSKSGELWTAKNNSDVWMLPAAAFSYNVWIFLDNAMEDLVYHNRVI